MFRQSISREVFVITFIAPFFASFLITFMVSLIFIEGDKETFFKSDVALLTTMFYLYGVYSASMGMHALAKAFKPSILSIRDRKLVDLVKFFHGPFSHILSNMSGTLAFSLLLLFNINHPARESLTITEIIIIISSGIILGILLSIVYAIGNALSIMLKFLLVQLIILGYFVAVKGDNLNQAPLSIFVLTTLSTSLLVLCINSFGPYKNRFMKKVDEKFVSVEKDWKAILK